MQKKGFTLIELLIVVAIIGILAAIAIPNFMNAQVRAKVARAKADMHAVATALETYRVDQNTYPNDHENGWPWYLTRQLTTPIKYMSTSELDDPFRMNKDYPGDDPLGTRYRYLNYVANLDSAEDNPDGHNWGQLPGPDYPDSDWRIHPYSSGCTTGMRLFGQWKLSSAGPDQDANDSFFTVDLIYDPSNGTVSEGDIIRCQKMADVKG